MNGTDLLARFRESGSETAFSELVRRYTRLVYSAARRRLASDALAQEATQIVFIRLARSVPKLQSDAALAAWLHRTTLHVSVDLWRSESRRSAREEQAATMQPVANESALWNEITPVVDQALNKLNDLDRQTLLLRFFEQKSMRDLGAAFGVTEDAAKMRVSRALDRLRQQLTTCGITCTAIALGALLAQRSVEAVPAQLAATLASIAWPAPATGLAGLFLRVSAPKLAAVAAGLVLAGAIAVVLLRTGRTVDPPSVDPAPAAQNAVAPAADAAAIPAADVDLAAPELDGLKLLQAVARARNRFTSGTMELQIFTDRYETGRKETNYVRLKIAFDGSRKWSDSLGQQYHYVGVGSEAASAAQAKIEEEKLDRAGAIRAGLLAGFDAHYVTAYDGTTCLQYRESDGKVGSATVGNPEEAISTFLFDPRCLGLKSYVYRQDTVGNCLGYTGADSVKLIGLESVDGTAAWHVEVVTSYKETFHFWIESAHPVRVIRYVNRQDIANSKYDDATPDNPIPIEVATTSYKNGKLLSTARYIQTSAEFNQPIDPALWTLAGLGMQVGANVVDVRIQRQIGYWTGAGLTENLPNKKAPAPVPPDRTALLALMNDDPRTPEALAAATWILLNSPDGPDVDKAADVILSHHISNPDLANLAEEMDRVRPRCARKLLEAMLNENPNKEVQATACFTLATLLKDQAQYGKNKEATRDAEKYFARVISEFSRTGPKGAEFARRSKPELNEIRRFFIGNAAPGFSGETLDGHRLNLSDYRGKIVVLFFWSESTASDWAEQDRMLARMANPPVSLGIYCDDNLAKGKAAVEQYQLSGPSLRDGRQGPIANSWNVHSWLSSFVLDAKGVIRYRNMRWGDLTNAVDTLLRE